MKRGPLHRLLDRRTNELRRSADRIRGHWLAVLALSPLVAVLCAIAVGLAVWQAESRTAQAEALHRHQVSATTVGEADRALPLRFNSTPLAMARTTWEYPASHRHTNSVAVPAGTPVGGTVKVWVDDAGQVAPAPRASGELASTAVATGAGAFGVVVLAAGGLVWLRLRSVEARSLVQWDREWECVEPRWSGRTRRGPGANG
ncbi:hypothetical protein ABZZ20_01465 [Streptomyces sp. NPDC006430]|uniref:Rv1733c family protein n=1 Tax=Streptomyces sp. NPDC006430 TaxID=3154299 RepID=UPI0033B828DB